MAYSCVGGANRIGADLPYEEAYPGLAADPYSLNIALDESDRVLEESELRVMTILMALVSTASLALPTA